MDVQALSATLSRRPWAEYLGVALLLSALALLAHGASLAGFWRWDDGAHLNYAARHAPWQYFFDARIARGYSSANLTPWNLLFYDLNLSLFGMEPAGHYAHLLVLVALGSVLFYAVLRQFLAPLPALLGAVALLLGKPTAHIAAGLMHGHYASGFVLCMLAILGWTVYCRGGRARWLWISAVAYLLATACKEVYVPLVVLLPLLPAGPWQRRLRALAPFVAIALLYAGWRYLMLGRLLGGYTQGAFDAGEAVQQLLRIPRLLLGSKPPGHLLTMAFAGLLCLAACQRRLNGPLAVAMLALVLLPLLPLTAFPGIHSADRYLFVPWLACAACLAAIFPPALSWRRSAAAGAVLVAALAGVHAQERQVLKDNLAYWDTLYRFALSLNKERQAIFVAAEFGGTDDGYKRSVLTNARRTAELYAQQHAPGELLVIDEQGRGLDSAQVANMQVFEFKRAAMVPMSAQALAEKLPRPTFAPPSSGPQR